MSRWTNRRAAPSRVGVPSGWNRAGSGFRTSVKHGLWRDESLYEGNNSVTLFHLLRPAEYVFKLVNEGAHETMGQESACWMAADRVNLVDHHPRHRLIPGSSGHCLGQGWP